MQQANEHRRFVYCRDCYLKHRAGYHFGDRSLWSALLEKLEQQAYRCPYTGEPLALGVNASIDHRLPASRYPEMKTDIANFDWVTKDINAAKGDRTPEEFLAWIAAVYDYAVVHAPSRGKL
jgi:5-methylcytosine-specific restriction endonuclease McrA